MSIKDKNYYASCLFRVPIFSHLNEKEKEDIVELINVKKFKKGEAIYNAGQENPFLYVVHQGKIKISRYNDDGNEQVVRVLSAGDFAGEHALFTKGFADDFAISLEDSMVCVLDGNSLKKHMIEKPEISIQIINELSNRLSDTENKLEQYSLSSVEKRLADSIINLSQGKSSFVLPISKFDWASMLGMSQETLSRKLREFKNKKIIELNGQRGITILNNDYLEDMS